MRRSYPVWCVLAVLAIFGPVGVRIWSRTWHEPPSLADNAEQARSGEILFNHEWEVNDPLCPNGDGLGPVFNARSCVACHHQGGPGGGGAAEHNVTTFTMPSAVADAPPRQGVVHTFATDSRFQERFTLLDPRLPDVSQLKLEQTPRANHAGDQLISGVRFDRGVSNILLSQRNTPALFGAGLIDSIPDKVIIANERRQRVRFGMALSNTEMVPVGRAHRLPDGQIGRFGWKAQTARLADFVQAACANELGLGNPTNAQPQSMAQLGYSAPGLDLSQSQCDDLTAFVAALPRPVEKLPAAQERQVHNGKALFTKIGCADCHTPTLGSVSGIYSDLLLHRMGMELEGSGESYGGQRQPTTPTSTPGSMASQPLPDEWRTPPLWGVADSAPYMHDGRAAKLEDAIAMHGGQASRSAELFQALHIGAKKDVIAFLHTLRAP